jgi:peptidoglycan-associated lipoprotein
MMPPHFANMNKIARIFFTLLLTFFLLSGCTRKQAPSRYNDETANRSGNMSDSGFTGDIVPGGDSTGWGTDGELLQRGANGGISNNMYEGREMVRGELPSIYFGFDSSSVSASERSKLQQAADYLEQNPGHHLLIEGYCDWYGTSEYNLALGDRRAGSASDYLGTLGITPLRINKLSKGSLEATGGLSKSQSSQDRRADLIILK